MKTTITLLIFVVALVGCAKGDLVEQPENGTPRETLLYRRSNASPVTLSVPMTSSDEDVALQSGNVVDLFDLLGRNYSPQKGTICEYKNVGLPIVNIKALKETTPDYVRYLPLKSGKALVKAFSSSKSYEEYIKNELSVRGSSVSLKLPFFTAGANASFNRFFSEDFTSLDQGTLGIASLEVQAGRYQIFEHNQVMREVKMRYLNPVFVDQLYNRPLQETFYQKLGPYVLTHFTTGGRAEVLYYGKTNKTTTASEREEKLQGAMNASLSIASAGGGAKASVNSIDRATYEQKYGHNEILVGSHIVGSPVATVVSTAKDLSDVKISFDNWMASMNDKKNHTLSGIAMDGLQPLQNFVIEENFRWQIENEAFNSKFYTPRIEILVSHSDSIPLEFGTSSEPGPRFVKGYVMEVRLDTRQGVYVYLSPTRKDLKKGWTFIGESDLDQAIKEQVTRLKTYYDVDIVKIICPSPHYSRYGNPLERMRNGAGAISFDGLDESKMKKWQHPTYGIKYLFYNDGKGKRYAYSIHRDAMLDTYGIRKLYDNAPLAPAVVKIMDLSDYVIVGL